MNAVSLFRRPDPVRANTTGRIFMIDINSISPNPSQPRKNFEGEAMARLADSIRCYGILQPVTVRAVSGYDSGGTVSSVSSFGADVCDMPLALYAQRDLLISCDGAASDVIDRRRYELIAGERRLMAARIAGLTKVPCIIIEADDRRSAELAMIENIQCEKLNIFEQAGAIASLIDVYSLTQEQAAEHLSSSQSYVANKLRILRLTEPERRLILDNGLSERHARALLRLSTPEERIAALNVVISRELTVAATEQYIDRVIRHEESVRMSVRRKFVLKDIRVLYNTIDRAVETVRDAGIDVDCARRETDDAVEVVIVVPKRYEVSEK